MNTTAERIRAEALALSASERANLAHDLILSLEEPDAYELDPAYEAEISQRVQAVREGTAEGRPFADLLNDVKAKYGR
jgi:putative addiction module component (TIGR02574 family)